MDAPSLLASVTALRTTSAMDAMAAAAPPLIAALGRGGSPAMAALTMSLTSFTGTIALDVA
jgi:spore maturation protein SpmB